MNELGGRKIMNESTTTTRSGNPSLGLARAVSAWVVGALSVTACGADLGGAVDEDVDTLGQSFTGTMTFRAAGQAGACTQAQKDTINGTASIAFANLASDEMLRCLAYHDIMQTNGDSAEVIMQRMREALTTLATCENLTDEVAHAPVGIQSEQVAFDIRHLAHYTREQLAATLLHELAHNKGYRHLGGEEFFSSVPKTLEYCSAYMSSHSYETDVGFGRVPRSDAIYVGRNTASTVLGPVGGEGGGPNYDQCGRGTFASGLVGRAGSVQLDKLGLKCRGASGTGYDTALTQRGGNGGTSFSDACPSGTLLAGISGGANDRLRRIRGWCISVADIARKVNTSGSSPSSHGAPDGPSFERWCPAGQAIKGIRTRSGSAVDNLVLECEDISSTKIQYMTTLGQYGTATDAVYLERCPRSSVMNHLFGASGAELDRLGGECRQVATEGDHLKLLGIDASLPARGGYGGDDFSNDSCPQGAALVGLNLRSAEHIVAIQGVCADVAAWSGTGAEPALTTLAQHGGTRGSSASVTCGRGGFISGWQISEGIDNSLRVFGLEPRCIYPGS
jgi:hypothetical protein